MAFTERYVTQAAGGSGDGSIGDPWTIAEGFANIVEGERLNIQSDGVYNIAGLTQSNAGTAWASANLIVFRGYNSSIGDLDGQGRNSSDGSLDTTDFPSIISSGSIVPNARSIFMNLNISGSVNGILFGGAANDNIEIVHCKVVNSANNANAIAIEFDNFCGIVNCDVECTGADHNAVCSGDSSTRMLYNRIKATAASESVVFMRFGSFVGNSVTAAGGVGVEFESAFPTTATNGALIASNTIYNASRAFDFASIATTMAGVNVINNHVTDCTYKYYISAATALFMIEQNTRSRDITSGNNNLDDGSINMGEVTTDTGGPSTDYEDASIGDLRLISAAPGIDAGVGIG
jgi:hypothetical protein